MIEGIKKRLRFINCLIKGRVSISRPILAVILRVKSRLLRLNKKLKLQDKLIKISAKKIKFKFQIIEKRENKSIYKILLSTQK